jgi:hypothetical protein
METGDVRHSTTPEGAGTLLSTPHQVADGSRRVLFASLYLILVSLLWITLAALRFLQALGVRHPWWGLIPAGTVGLVLGAIGIFSAMRGLRRGTVSWELFGWLGLVETLWALVFVVIGIALYIPVAVLSAGLLVTAAVLRWTDRLGHEAHVADNLPYKDPFRGPTDPPDLHGPDKTLGGTPFDQGKWNWPG